MGNEIYLLAASGLIIGILIAERVVIYARLRYNEMIARNANEHSEALKDAMMRGWGVRYVANTNMLHDGTRAEPL